MRIVFVWSAMMRPSARRSRSSPRPRGCGARRPSSACSPSVPRPARARARLRTRRRWCRPPGRSRGRGRRAGVLLGVTCVPWLEMKNGSPEAAVLKQRVKRASSADRRIWQSPACPWGRPSISNSTFWFSLRVLKPEPWISEKWAKRSSPPPSGLMKPKPLESLNHFTVPVLIAFPFWLIPGKPTGLGSASKGKQGGN